jgi:subtilisin family serine protease
MYSPRAEDFAADDPALPGLPLAFNTVFAVIEPSATVGGVNAALRAAGARIVGGIPGRSGTAPGVLALRLETLSHTALAPVLASLRATPGLRVVTRDVVLRSDAVTRIGAVNWAWDREPNTDFGTWGLTAIRVPQLWNLNAQLAAASAQVSLGVLDEGFHLDHEDLAGRITADGTPRTATHGTQVSGIIAAGFNNGKGTDGVTPFARLVGRAIDFVGRDKQVTLGTATWGLADLVRNHPELVAVNVSVGYNWSAGAAPRDTRNDQEARALADAQGRAVRGALEAIGAETPLPVIVASAGNDSRLLPDQEARFSSPFANAALEQGVAAIIVVESDSARMASGTVDYVRSDFSNTGGHLSAPGSRITGPTSAPSAYGAASGTSFAAPLVTGVIGYLFGLEPLLPRPTLTTNQLRDLLQEAANRSPSRNGRVQLDAFASALRLDLLTNSDRVLRRLLDIDDGTPDGNRRIDPVTGTEVTTDAPLADNGRIDIADFRRWRDWLLQLEDVPGLALDGDASANLKRDVNGDGLVQSPQEEALFPRGDFNGDGRLSPTATAVVPGVLATLGPLTDLQVLQRRFTDADYDAAELDALIESGDVVLRTTSCAPGTTATMRAEVQRIGSRVFAHTFAPAESEYVMTVPLEAGAETEWRVRTQLTGIASGLRVADRVDTVRVRRGDDVPLVPACERIGGIWSGTFNATFTPFAGGGSRESPGTLEFRMNVNGNEITGGATLVSFFGPGAGQLQGTLVGTTISSFGFDAVNSASGCRGTFTGTAQVSAAAGTMTVSYSGADCNGTITNGQASLRRTGD